MQFGFVPDDPNIFTRLTGLEYLNFMADMYNVPSLIRLGPSANSPAAFRDVRCCRRSHSEFIPMG